MRSRAASAKPVVARAQSVPPPPQPERSLRRPQSAASSVARSSRATTTLKSVAVPGVDSKLVELIENEIVDRSPSVKWDDIGNHLLGSEVQMIRTLNVCLVLRT